MTAPSHNIIVLTHGLSGSSVLTNLIARGGFWTGDQTFKKHDYDTHENHELIELNRQIIEASGYTGAWTMEFSPDAITRVAAVAGQIDEKPFRAFIDKCNAHGAWIWKDPRLWLTIRVWAPLLDLERCRFVVLTRDNLQLWVSATLRRQIQTFDFSRRYTEGITASLDEFVRDNRLPHVKLYYEDLVLEPEPTIARLNDTLGTSLTLEDLKAVYRNELYKKPRSNADLVKAVLIYLKNYRQRYK